MDPNLIFGGFLAVMAFTFIEYADEIAARAIPSDAPGMPDESE